ncbi:MAG: polyphosphate kinase 2 family protein [Thermomicrobiales bacterium]
MPKAIRVEPGSRVNLARIDTRENGGLTKGEGKARLGALAAELNELQDLLYAADECSVLVVLQGMDTSGKDGTIKSVFRAVDPLGVHTWSFKVPTEIELAHDFLWRVHRRTPERGKIAIFNRSHYEDVLVVRVKELAPVDVWRKRYDHINAFERLLTDSNTIVLKFFLHISKEEQEERLLARETEVDKAWKLSVGDWEEREWWDAYQEAYEDALAKCSTANAPWYIVPADRKWYRDLVIAQTIVETMKPRTKAWMTSLAELGEVRKAELTAMRSGV